MTRGEFLGGCLVALLITCSPGLAGVVVTALTGPDRLDSPAPASVGEAAQEREASPWVLVHPRPQVASRSERRAERPAGTSLHWAALAACESSNDPRAVSASGTYRGAFQMDADFWRTYGGLRFASRPDLASYGEQLEVAKAGYAARGRQPWPVCGRRL